MPLIPEFLVLTARGQADRFAGVIDLARAAVRAAGLVEPDSWSAGDETSRHRQALRDAITTAESSASPSIVARWPAGDRLRVANRRAKDYSGSEVEIHRHVGRVVDAVRPAVNDALEAARTLLNGFSPTIPTRRGKYAIGLPRCLGSAAR